MFKIKPYKGQSFTTTMHVDVKNISGELYNDKMSAFEHYIGGIAEVAYGALVDAEEQVIKAGLYKQTVKQRLNHALHSYQAMQRDSFAWHNHQTVDYWITYADAYAMCIAPLAERFKRNIMQVCVDFRKVPHAEAVGALILAYNWLAIAADNFDYGVASCRKWIGYDFRTQAPFRDIGKLKKEVFDVIGLIYSGPVINLNEYKRVHHTADLIFQYVADAESVYLPGLASAILHKDKYPSLMERVRGIQQHKPKLYRKAEALAAKL